MLLGLPQKPTNLFFAFLFLLYLFIILALTGCTNAKELNRVRAADIIQSSGSFQESRKLPIATGGFCGSLEKFQQNDNKNAYIVLKSLGLVELTNDGDWPECGGRTKVSFSDKGRVESKSWTLVESHPGTNDYWDIDIADREIVEITGITQGKEGEAKVEFTWKWVPANEIGKRLLIVNNVFRTAIQFQLYDDGWRVNDQLL
jgi:hypothetical protein